MTSSNPKTDQDIINNRTPGTNPDLDVSQSAAPDSGVNPLAGTQGSDADTHNSGQVPVAGYTPDQLGAMGRAGQPSAGGSENRLGNLGGGQPGISGQTTNMDDTGAIERGATTDGEAPQASGRPMDTAAAPGTAGTANQTDTTIGENYTGGPIQVDPEQQLLNPGYEPDIAGDSGRQAATPGRPSGADSPTLGGMPNQQGQQDQTAYTDRGQ